MTDDISKDEINDMFDSISSLFFEWERAADSVGSRELRQKFERHSFALAHDFFSLGLQLMNHFDPAELFCGDTTTSKN